MLRELLPCADPQCKDKMRLVFQNERFIGYRCLLKPNSHNFRYDIERDRWEKIILSTKPIIGYKEHPRNNLFEDGRPIESL
ncbi:MAG: hypothetical protein NWF03_08215 [Candidatus Bathyarchaeota archaeon]|nr:hypothetical protein [Candidatus Bathyarchaeota archaeon]